MSHQHPLRIEAVRKTFTVAESELIVLERIDLDVAHNEIVAILGASGCGKSTLLRLISGLESPDHGNIHVRGRRVATPGQDSAIVFQDHRLMPWLTVFQNVDLALDPLHLRAKERRNRVRHYLDLVGLGAFADAWPRQLSGGMAQRAAIARALVVEPELLLMDEPFGALDSLLRTRLQDELLEIWERNRVTIVLVTHDVEEAIYLADRVVLMHPGPGRIHRVFDIASRRPRDREANALVSLRGEIRASLGH